MVSFVGMSRLLWIPYSRNTRFFSHQSINNIKSSGKKEVSCQELFNFRLVSSQSFLHQYAFSDLKSASSALSKSSFKNISAYIPKRRWLWTCIEGSGWWGISGASTANFCLGSPKRWIQPWSCFSMKALGLWQLILSLCHRYILNSESHRLL